MDVFEQSLLIDGRPSKSWSFLASVSAELVAVSVMILIPLIYGDHLTEFHWRTVTMGPPVRPVEPPPASEHATTASANTIVPRRATIYSLMRASQVSEPAAPGPVAFDAPPGSLPGNPAGAFNPIGNIAGRPVIAGPPPPKPAAPSRPSGPLRVSSGVQQAKLVKQVIPVYPPIAKSAHIAGVVHLVGIIARDGTIRDLQLISGHPILARAAMEAVRQWVYRPTLLSGEPVEVICPIDVNFTISQ